MLAAASRATRREYSTRDCALLLGGDSFGGDELGHGDFSSARRADDSEASIGKVKEGVAGSLADPGDHRCSGAARGFGLPQPEPQNC